MLSYCLKCKKNTEKRSTRVSKTSNGKTMLSSKCAICGSKRSIFIKKHEVIVTSGPFTKKKERL